MDPVPTDAALPQTSTVEIQLPQIPPIDIRPDRWQKLTAIGSVLNGLTVLALGAGLYFTNQANRQQQQLAVQAQVSDRFSKAIEQLGNNALEIRLGGIYSLERLMKDSPDDQPTVAEVLSAFVRNHNPHATSTPSLTPRPNPTADTQAALTVLGRQPRARYGHPDLSGANLSHAWLGDANLSQAWLVNTNLTKAHLHHADLTRANLAHSWLVGTDLTGANLAGANLTHTWLGDANLTDANLTGAITDKDTVLPPGVKIPDQDGSAVP